MKASSLFISKSEENEFYLHVMQEKDGFKKFMHMSSHAQSKQQALYHIMAHKR